MEDDNKLCLRMSMVVSSGYEIVGFECFGYYISFMEFRDLHIYRKENTMIDRLAILDLPLDKKMMLCYSLFY